MRVKLKTMMAGPAGCHDAGSVVTVSDDAGAAMVRDGFAVRVDPVLVVDDEPEVAQMAAPEQAVTRRGRPRKLRGE